MFQGNRLASRSPLNSPHRTMTATTTPPAAQSVNPQPPVPSGRPLPPLGTVVPIMGLDGFGRRVEKYHVRVRDEGGRQINLSLTALQFFEATRHYLIDHGDADAC